LIMYLEANNIKIEDVMSELDNRKKWIMIITTFLPKF
jgi:phosphoribosyl-ATP pyrophosphohydrolase